MVQEQKELRSGFTTGACAAAAAKAAALLLVRSAECGVRNERIVQAIEIPFPDGSRVQFKVHHSELRTQNAELISSASVIKDAGDDPDVTHGAEIVATVRNAERGVRSEELEVILKGGKGVGRVTKPGLAVPVGEAAINPVPRKMISAAVMEAWKEFGVPDQIGTGLRAQFGVRTACLEVTISVLHGEELAKKTLNHRLGIIGGISILGTTGVVRPLSDDAWTATIESSLSVARALGREEVVLSTGRTSERAHQRKYGLPEECYAMMGDYTEFSLRAARDRGFRRIHLCAQWAKMIKIAMATPQTHVRHGALDAEAARDFLINLGIQLPFDKKFNTSREVYDHIQSASRNPHSALEAVCGAARRYCEQVTGGLPVSTHLASYEGEIVAESE